MIHASRYVISNKSPEEMFGTKHLLLHITDFNDVVPMIDILGQHLNLRKLWLKAKGNINANLLEIIATVRSKRGSLQDL